MIPIRSTTKHIRITEVDENIFVQRFFARCSDCQFCKDICCSHGCAVDMAERDWILMYARDLETELGIPSWQWFEEKTTKDPEYPSGEHVRTKVRRTRCVFFDHYSRGCHLHRFPLGGEGKLPTMKPMVCSLFPLTWDGNRLFVSDFLSELPCKDHGISIFEARKEGIRIHLGNDLTHELEAISLVQGSTKI